MVISMLIGVISRNRVDLHQRTLYMNFLPFIQKKFSKLDAQIVEFRLSK